MYDSIGTTTYCMIICMKSRLTSFSYDSVTEGCISVKFQLLTVNFVGFGCQPGFRLHTSRQSFEPSYTQIQALLVFFLIFALASQPLWWLETKNTKSLMFLKKKKTLCKCYISNDFITHHALNNQIDLPLLHYPQLLTGAGVKIVFESMVFSCFIK